MSKPDPQRPPLQRDQRKPMRQTDLTSSYRRRPLALRHRASSDVAQPPLFALTWAEPGPRRRSPNSHGCCHHLVTTNSVQPGLLAPGDANGGPPSYD